MGLRRAPNGGYLQVRRTTVVRPISVVESVGTYEAELETAGPDDNEEKPNRPEGSDEEEYYDQPSSNDSKESGTAQASCQNQWYQYKKEGKIQKLESKAKKAKLVNHDYN
ncbi:hypothetical protein MMC29_001192 [Sticta canariensis]|nr:hypothetical protein [Sticta canariensis]